MGGKVRKPYLVLRGRPILAWTLSALAHVQGLRQIVLVTRPEDRRRAQAAAKLARIPPSINLGWAEGGPRRQDSVFNGLRAADESDLVLIHDAARPFPSRAAISAACAQAFTLGAAILACRVKDTVKRAAGGNLQPPQIETTLSRDGLWLAQTPQVFKRKLILELFTRLRREAPAREVTDDAALCELYEQPVALIESSEINLKVTRSEDLAIASAYLSARLWRDL